MSLQKGHADNATVAVTKLHTSRSQQNQYTILTAAVKPTQGKTAYSLHHNKTCNTVLLTQSHAVGGSLSVTLKHAI
jgi:uncharacterized membrane protein